jgi:hypothetical protein
VYFTFPAENRAFSLSGNNFHTTIIPAPWSARVYVLLRKSLR